MKALSMKRFSFAPVGILLGLLLTSINAFAGTEVQFGAFPANGSVVNSGQNFGNVSAIADYTGWDCNQDAHIWSSGGCWLNNGGATELHNDGGVGCGDRSVTASVQMKAGTLQACTLRLRASMDGSTTDQSRTVYVRQIITLNNPGAKDDVEPDYTVYASGKTADGISNTINGTSNKLNWVSLTPSICTIASTNISSAVIHNVTFGTCTVRVTATGDANISASGATDQQSWQVINTQFPKLELLTPVSQGVTPSFTYSSSQAGTVSIGGACAPGTGVTNIGNNTYRLKTLVVGTLYSDCFIRVTNAELLYADLALPPFRVTVSVGGPGGVGGNDGSTDTMLWLNGDNLPASGTISAWLDQSGRDNNFSTAGGGAGTVSDPFISIQNARDRVTTAGLYFFNLSGNAFSTYVDASGYVLVASANGSTNGVYTTTTALSLQSDKVLTAGALAALGSINEVRMNVATGADSGFNVTTSNATIISEVKANSQLPNATELGSNVWAGSNSYMNSSCNSGTPNAALTNGIYHACGNGSGMHWIQASNVEKVNNSNANTNLNLWVRAAASSGNSPVVGTWNGFKVASYDGSERYLRRLATNLNARSTFIVYRDTSNGGTPWATPFTSNAATGHGHSDDTQLYNATYTNALTLGGVAYFNNTLESGLTHDRPDNYEIFSQVYAGNYSSAQDWWIGSDSCNCGNRSINGGIAEVLVYKNAINNAQRTIIENYLYAKYFNGTYPALASAIYTYGGTGAYKYDMAGIGQHADASSHLSAKGNMVQVNNPTSLGAGRYIMWAHDNGAAAFQNSDVTSPVIHRLTRKWRVRNTGLGNSDLTLHLADLPGFATMCFNPANLVLLLDGDGVFNAGATVIPGTYNSETQTVNYVNVPLANGNYFTFGIGGTPTDIYVAKKSAGSKSGSSWANACTLEGALNSPRLPGDTVKLAQGVYKPTSTMYITAGINVIGGYEGLLTSEVSMPDSFETVISGDNDNNDSTLGNIIMYHRDIRGSNLARLFEIKNVPTPVTLEGFYITGMSQGPPTLSDAASNHASVVWQENSTVTYNKMKIFGNRARELGGALLVYGGTGPTTANIIDSILLGNAGEHGGAVSAHVSATVNVTNSEFYNNYSLLLKNRGPGWNKTPGGAIDVSQSAILNVINSIFTGNSAEGTGGIGGAIAISQNAANNEAVNDGRVTITGSTFTDNSSNFGGAIAAEAGFNFLTINQSTFERNHGTNSAFLGGYFGSGGAIAAFGGGTSGKSLVTINDSVFDTNTATSLGGAMYFTGASVNKYLTANINTSTILSNTAGWGAGILAREFATGTLNQINVNNSTLTANSALNYGGALASSTGAKLNVKHSTVYANLAGVNGGGVDVRDASAALVLTNSLLFGNLANNAASSATGTDDSPFTSIGQARWWVVTLGNPAGTYYFNLEGVKFSTYVDGNGYVLVASTNATTATAMDQTVDLTLQSDQILKKEAFAALGNIDTIRISSPASKNGNFDMATTNASNLSRLKNFLPLQNNFDLGIAGNTSGNPWAGTHNSQMNGATCSDFGAYGVSLLSHNVLGHCGDGGDFHWQMERATGPFMTVVWSTPTPRDKMNLWVRAPLAAVGVGNNMYNNATPTVTATGYNLIGYNSLSGWQNNATANQAPSGNSFTSTVTNVDKIIATILADNGGLTKTFSLSSNGGAGSPAFNKVPIASCLPADQRGQARAIVGLFTKCDIGSYETIKTDDDEDGYINALDNCPTLSNASQTDTDGDNIGDICDPDIDGDGVLNANDFFPTISLGGRLDTDGDGIPNVCDAACITAGMYADPDIDNDTVLNGADNCVYDVNTDQNDIDGDGLGDVCDSDIDGDSVDNADDNCPGISNPLQVDSDGNGLGDDCNAIFIKPVAGGLGDCSSWNNACAGGTGTQLQAALDSAFAQNATQIYLAAGIYRPSATVNMHPGLILYGGFTGVDETYHYQATPDQNLTIITGDTANDDVLDVNGITQSYTHQVGSNLTRIFNADGLGTADDSVIGFNGMTITGAGATSAIRVKNSRIRMANTKILGNKGVSGAGLLLETNAKVVVTDSQFANNQAVDGGAVYITSSTSEASLTRVDFTANNATSLGGALAALASSKVNLRSSAVFDNQSAGSGGAIYVDGTDTFNVIGTVFSGNRTLSAVANTGGGAIRAQGNFKTIYIGTSDFVSNTSANQAGALMIWSNQDIGSTKVVTIEDTLFKSNRTIGGSANAGGAISVGASVGTTTVTASRNSFVSNTGTVGGGINFAGGNGNQLVLDNSTFFDNRSTSSAGAINLNNGADANVSHITVLQNVAATNGGGIRVENTGSVLTIKNSLLIDNTGADGANISHVASHIYSDGGYNIIGFNGISGLKTGGTNNETPASPSKVAVAATVAAILTPTLSDYSGLHISIPLTATSEARDLIPNGTNGCVTGVGYDERGFERPDMIDVTDPEQAGDVRKCDVGAFEFNNAYRVDCFPEDGLRPDQGTGFGYYYCEDGTKPSAGELVNSLFLGKVEYYMLWFMLIIGFMRKYIVRKNNLLNAV